MFKIRFYHKKDTRHIAATLILMSCALFLAADASARGIPTLTHECVTGRSLLYAGTDSVSRFYRIPAITTLPDGTIITTADRRFDTNRDLPSKIDVICRTSTDGGNTWSDAVIVAGNDEGGGYGDAALGVDPISGDAVCVFTHGEGLWTSKDGSHARICVNRSSDGGRTWTAPVDITPSLFSQTEGAAPVTCITAFATSGAIHTDPDGTMWFMIVVRHDKEKTYGPLRTYAVRSTDGGHTWESLPAIVDADADESKIVTTADGALLASIRNRHQKFRKFARSTDGGKSWSPAEASTTLRDPACNGDIIALPNGRLLHSLNDDSKERQNISISVSDDNGATWTKLIQLTPTGILAAYSAMSLIAPDTLGVLTEEKNAEGGLRIWFTRIDLDKLLNSADAYTPFK